MLVGPLVDCATQMGSTRCTLLAGRHDQLISFQPGEHTMGSFAWEPHSFDGASSHGSPWCASVDGSQTCHLLVEGKPGIRLPLHWQYGIMRSDAYEAWQEPQFLGSHIRSHSTFTLLLVRGLKLVLLVLLIFHAAYLLCFKELLCLPVNYTLVFVVGHTRLTPATVFHILFTG